VNNPIITEQDSETARRVILERAGVDRLCLQALPGMSYDADALGRYLRIGESWYDAACLGAALGRAYGAALS
jgi:hypothetical protein